MNAPLAGLGVGLRGPHVPEILRARPAVPWFELLTDNHLAAGGALRFQAEAIAEHYPVALHGVGMSLGGADPLDPDYLERVRGLARRTGARHVSEHLSFTARGGVHSHDLLPLPWTEEALELAAARAREAQARLDAPFLIENVSTYLEYEHSTLGEGEFLAELCARADCGLLLDLNNAHVNAVNHGRDPFEFLDAVPWERVGEIHLAGHAERGGLLIDTHGAPVGDDVIELFVRALPRAPTAPVLLERDTRIPPWAELWAEAQRLERVRREALA